MFRRAFMQRIAMATGVAAVPGHAAENVSVTFSIEGFTCVTCAIGLEVVLRKQTGVTRAKASYPERKAIIGYDPKLTSPETLKTFIDQTTGFTVSELKG